MSFSRTIQQSPRVLEKPCTVVVRVKEFSNVDIHNPREETSQALVEYDVSCCYFEYQYPIIVCPNGHDSSSEGFVSLALRAEMYLKGWRFWHGKFVEMSVLISVLGNEGPRFSRSFSVLGDFTKPDANPELIADRYISRGALLDERDELLGPDDILTLHLDIHFKETQYRVPYADIAELAEFVRVRFRTRNDDPLPVFSQGSACDVPLRYYYYLSLDSSVMEQLQARGTDDYFRRMSVTPLIERCSKYRKSLEENNWEEYYENTISFAEKLMSHNSFSQHLARDNIDMRTGDVSEIFEFADNIDGDWLNEVKEVFMLKEAPPLQDRTCPPYAAPSIRYKEHPRHMTIGSLLFGGAAGIVVHNLDEITDLYFTATKNHVAALSLKDICVRWFILSLKSLESSFFAKKQYRNDRHQFKDFLGEFIPDGLDMGGYYAEVWERAQSVEVEKDLRVKQAAARILAKREMNKSSFYWARWLDFRSNLGPSEYRKWTCKHVIPSGQPRSSHFLFEYRLNDGEAFRNRNRCTDFEFYA